MRNQMTERNSEVEKMRGGKVEKRCLTAQPLKFLSSYLMVLLVTLSLTACGGGGEGSSSAPDGVVTFTGSATIYNIYMAQNTSESSGSVLAIDIKVDDILPPGIYGADFDVDFNSSKMTYNSYSTGNFLETGGIVPSYSAALESGNSNKLKVSLSREGSPSSISGSGTLITLKFNVTGGGSISFSNHELLDENGNIIPASWSPGGTVSVQ